MSDVATAAERGLNPLTAPDRAAAMDAGLDRASRVFKTLHGFYGVLFSSKFANGVLTSGGGDAGIEGAREIWGYGLQRYDQLTIRRALASCLESHPKYPPNMPEFIALCEREKPRPVASRPEGRIEMSQAARSEAARRCREINEKHNAKKHRLAEGFAAPESGLAGVPVLIQLTAQALGLAGGDEAAALIRMDRELMQKRGDHE